MVRGEEPPADPDDDFWAIGPSARATAREANQALEDEAVSTTANTPTPSKARSEDYETQYALSEVAHRKWRGIAFIALGFSCLVYLVILPVAVYRLVDDFTLAIMATAGNGGWHVIALVALVLVILAAVPLSLSLTLVRMISRSGGDSTDSKDELGITTPQIEFVKALLEMFKIAQKK